MMTNTLRLKTRPTYVLMTFLLCAATVRLCTCSPSSTSVSKLFQRLSRSGLTLSRQREAGKLKCVRQCLASSSCQGLCHSVSTSACYLSEASSPSAGVLQLPGDVLDFTCYTTKACPADLGYAMHGGLCVKLYTEYLTYLHATARCADDGGHLFHYKSVQWDISALHQLLDTPGAEGSHAWWVGADDLDAEGIFVWRSDGSLLLANELVWNIGEPNGWDAENCLQLFTSLMRLVDHSCSVLSHFVCQVDM